MPNSLIVVTLVSNFGTFLLYMLTCVIAIMAFREHHSFSGIKHMVIPVVGLIANLGCMSVLPDRALYGYRHEHNGALCRFGSGRCLGTIARCTSRFPARKKGKTVLVAKPAEAKGCRVRV